MRDSFTYEDGRLDVDFGCDRLGAIEEITLQHGDGHGGTLNLVRLRRGADGLDWELLMLRYAAQWRRSGPDDLAAGVWRGRVSAAEVERALEISRAALVLEAEEHAPDERNMGITSSSGDFHAFLRLVDERGHARTVRFAGYPSSVAQLEWRIAALAVWPLLELVMGAKVELVQPDADSRAFFVERFVEAEAIDDMKAGAWWVQGRLIAMAGVHGTLDLVPTLGMRLCPVWEDGELLSPVGSYAGEALASVFGLLGRDEAVAVDERERLIAEQALYWIAACDISCTGP